MILIHRKPQIQELKLSIVSIQQIAARRTILASTPHVLAQPVERRAFCGVPFGIFAIALPDIVFKRLNPIDFVGLLEGTREHRRLNHSDGAFRSGTLPFKRRLGEADEA